MKIRYHIALILCLVMVANIFAKVEISADFDNGHMRPGTKITEEGDNVTIVTAPFSTDRDLWFYFKLTGVKNKTVFLKRYIKTNDADMRLSLIM